MRKISAVILLIVSSYAGADDELAKETLSNALEIWEPESITVNGATATILAKEDRITEQIYLSMVGGVCLHTISVPGNLLQLNEINFLNRHGQQGYIFEGGETDCKEYVELPIGKSKIWVLGRTHMK